MAQGDDSKLEGTRAREPVSVQPLSIEEARSRLVGELASHLPSEEHLVSFLLELQPIRGSWELVEMARHAGDQIDDFWRIGVLEWLGRDEEGERLAELNRVFRALFSYQAPAAEDTDADDTEVEDSEADDIEAEDG